jgi:adenine phosphoribosyltransferase
MKIFKDELINSIRNNIPIYQDWPKSGVNFLNTVELCKHPKEFNDSIAWFAENALQVKAEAIFAADARGFIWGSATANMLKLPMYPVRKIGKLPGVTYQQTYQLEYGFDTLELGEIKEKYKSVMIIDDVLATGGTAEAICDLIHNNLGIDYANITVAVLINLSFLPGASKLQNKSVKLVNLIEEL